MVFVTRFRFGLMLALVSLLAACGGTETVRTPPARIAALAIPEGGVPFAEGPIGSACLIHRRAQATRSRCGCIQAAADITLSQSQQQRATTYFSDPARLQEVRQSDASNNARFWDDWKVFADTAEQLCRQS